MSLSRLIKRGPIDQLPLMRQGLKMLLSDAEKGRHRLHIPRVDHTYRLIPGMHFHSLPEIFVQFSGTAIMEFPAEKLSNPPDTFTVIPRGVPHGEWCVPKPGPFYNMVISCGKDTVATHLSQEGHKKRPNIIQFLRFTSPKVDEINAMQDAMIAAFHGGGQAGKSKVRGLMIALLAELLEVVHTPQKEHRPGHSKIDHCQQLVAVHLVDSDLSVRSLAGWMGCSPDYLSNLFRTVTGARLTEYINQKRILHAQHLLVTTDLNINEIAWASGYADPGYFIRIFKKANGVTPRRYRRGVG